MKRSDFLHKLQHKARAAHFLASVRNHTKPDLYEHMFIEDVYSLVIPFSKKHGAEVEIVGNDDARSFALDLCRSLSRYDWGDDAQLVLGAVDDIAMHLAWNGYALFEIVRLDGDSPQIGLSSFPIERLIRLPGFYVQVLRDEDRDYFKSTRRTSLRHRINVVPAKWVWKVSIPTKLGGQFGYRRLLKRLSQVPSAGPAFMTTDLKKGRFSKDFIPDEYYRSHAAYLARITNGWGWNRRDFSLKYDTEFYTFHRSLTFKWAQACLREHIVREFNELLKNLVIPATLAIKGIISSSEIMQMREDVIAGKLHYGEALKRTN